MALFYKDSTIPQFYHPVIKIGFSLCFLSFQHRQWSFLYDSKKKIYILYIVICILIQRWLFEYLKVDSISLSSRSISAVIYLKVVGAQNHPTILSYRTFGSKESKSFFTTEHLVVKNPVCSLLPNIR